MSKPNPGTAPRRGRRAAKRDLFAELGEGMEALAEERTGKRTLRTHAVEYNPPPAITIRTRR